MNKYYFIKYNFLLQVNKTGQQVMSTSHVDKIGQQDRSTRQVDKTGSALKNPSKKFERKKDDDFFSCF